MGLAQQIRQVEYLTYSYDTIGNITSKSDVGSYAYPVSGAASVRPHAVTTAGANSYLYDNNGNQTSGAGRTLEYTSYNLPKRIVKGSSDTSFQYDAEHVRHTQIIKTNGVETERTVYINPRIDLGMTYEKVTKNGLTKHNHYVNIGSQRYLYTIEEGTGAGAPK